MPSFLQALPNRRFTQDADARATFGLAAVWLRHADDVASAACYRPLALDTQWFRLAGPRSFAGRRVDVIVVCAGFCDSFRFTGRVEQSTAAQTTVRVPLARLAPLAARVESLL